MPFRLCYVREPWAWFTSKEPFTSQWGDDWNDAPYEANAGDPYLWLPQRNEPTYDVFKVAYEAELDTPDYGHFNSPYSVQDINAGAVAWLRSPSYINDKVVIPAGTSYRDFVKLITDAAGVVYVPLEPVFDGAETQALTYRFESAAMAAA